MAKSKTATVGSLPEGSVFHIILAAEPPLIPTRWKGAGVVVAQGQKHTEIFVNSGKYLFVPKESEVTVKVLGNTKPKPSQQKLNKLRQRFEDEGVSLTKLLKGDKVLMWRPALERYETYTIIKVGKKAVTLQEVASADTVPGVEVVHGRHKVLKAKDVKADEIP